MGKRKRRKTQNKKIPIKSMVRYEGLNMRRTGKEGRLIKINIYGKKRYAINRIAGKLRRRGCFVHRFGDPYSIVVLIPKNRL